MNDRNYSREAETAESRWYRETKQQSWTDALLMDKSLGPEEKLVGLVLPISLDWEESHYDDFPDVMLPMLTSVERLAEVTGLSEWKVRLAMYRLEDKLHISMPKGPDGPRYPVDLPE